jgi:hypothetical protein
MIQQTPKLEKEKGFESKLMAINPSDDFNNNLNQHREKNKIEKNLDQLSDIKSDCMGKLIHLRDKYSDLSLKIDNVLFDNIVLINNILNNLKSLEN